MALPDSLQVIAANKQQDQSLSDLKLANDRLLRMRWFQMIGTLVVILIIPTASIIAFCITQNPYCFTPCGLLIAPAWRLSNRITNFLFPQDAREFQVEIAKVLKIHYNKPTQE
jgi:hypothetical protein